MRVVTTSRLPSARWLEAITDQWAREGNNQLLQQHIEDARQLTGVLRLCIEKDVPLAFL